MRVITKEERNYIDAVSLFAKENNIVDFKEAAIKYNDECRSILKKINESKTAKQIICRKLAHSVWEQANRSKNNEIINNLIIYGKEF